MTTATAVHTKTRTRQLDPAHSSVDFSVKHMMMTTVRGHFKSVQAALRGDRDHPEQAGVDATIEVAVNAGVTRQLSLRATGSCQPRFIARTRSPKQRGAPTSAARPDGSCRTWAATTTAAPSRAATA